MTKFGKSVKIIHRKDSLRASKILQEKAFENPKIDFVWDHVVSDISAIGRSAAFQLGILGQVRKGKYPSAASLSR